MTPRPGSRGFVLVGVIMFVLALSILGMSLYAVSGYEAAFLGQSRDDNQALYAAQGGLDMVRERLALPPDSLVTAHEIEGVLGVVSATAYQDRGGGLLDSVGPVSFSGTPVQIVVDARVGVQQCTLRASYVPGAQQDYYKRLATVAEYFAPYPGPPAAPNGTTTLYGQIWDGGDPAADSSRIRLSGDPWSVPAGVDFMKRGTVSLPDIDAYVASHPVTGPPIYADTTDPNTTAIWAYDMANGPGVTVYGNPRDAAKFHPIHAVDIQVSGTAIWLVPHGLYTLERVGVYGTGTLVIVAQASNYTAADAAYFSDPANGTFDLSMAYADAGICIRGGLFVASTVNVILVSDARVEVMQQNNNTVSSTAANLSVYARSFNFFGPNPGWMQSLAYDGTHDGRLGTVIDNLLDLNLLPRPLNAASSEFALVRGSWQDVTP